MMFTTSQPALPTDEAVTMEKPSKVPIRPPSPPSLPNFLPATLYQQSLDLKGHRIQMLPSTTFSLLFKAITMNLARPLKTQGLH